MASSRKNRSKPLITANEAMKAGNDKHQLGRIGARAVVNRIIIQPTVAMSARAHNTTEHLIREAIPHVRATPLPLIVKQIIEEMMTDAERDALAMVCQGMFLASLDRLTAPKPAPATELKPRRARFV